MSIVTTEAHGLVGVVEMHRPPANFFSVESLTEITAGAQEMVSRGCRALVLCAEGKHFCAGADFSTGGVGDERVQASRELYAQAVRMFEIEVPVVAAVQGAAIGGGLGLACAADFRIATPTSRFHANFAMLGFHPGFGLSVSLPRIVGEQKALDMLLSARRIDGTEALATGLADRLVEPDSLRESAVAFAAELASVAPLAAISIKRTLRGGLAAKVRTTLEHELAEQARLWQTRDCEIGLAASMARSTPQFVGE